MPWGVAVRQTNAVEAEAERPGEASARGGLGQDAPLRLPDAQAQPRDLRSWLQSTECPRVSLQLGFLFVSGLRVGSWGFVSPEPRPSRLHAPGKPHGGARTRRQRRSVPEVVPPAWISQRLAERFCFSSLRAKRFPRIIGSNARNPRGCHYYSSWGIDQAVRAQGS